MRSLSWKISGALLLVVAISVGLTAWLMNINTENQFRQYVTNGNMMASTSIAEELGTFYQENSSWTALQSVINVFTTSTSQRILVSDVNGTVVADSDAQVVGQKSTDIGLSGGTSIEASGKLVGEVYVLSTGGAGSGIGGMGSGMMGGRGFMGGGTGQGVTTVTPENNFLDQLNSSLWKVGLITFAIALILGLILTRQITRPVRKLIDGVRHITHGELDHRIEVKSHDEIGELADSFNSMASSLEKVEQSRRQMTADIAHELRTPLTIIDGTVNGIIDEVFAPDSEHLSSILEQTSLLTRLINDLRDISKAEAGQLELSLVPTDITELVGKLIPGYQVRAGEKNINLSFTAAPDIPEITIDPARIEQVVTNLIMNAVRHVSPGGTINVSIDSLPTGITLNVADNGEGIMPDDLPHVFERFYRSGSSRSREKGGTGLGLAIVKQMVESHGGTVNVESTPGNGAAFRIFLPFTH